MKGTGVNPIGSSLFGQQNTLGQQQQGGLFGKPAGGFFSATTSAPTFPSATTASSLFGGQPQTGGLFGAAKPAGSSLFGAATSQPSGGLFGQQQQQPSSAFGSTTAGGAGLFGQNKPSAFGQVSQPSIFGGQPTTGGMFGGTAPSSVGGFGTATTTTTGLFGGQPQQSAFSFGQQPQQAAGSTNLFGAKPSQPFGFGAPSAPVFASKFAPPIGEDQMQLKGTPHKVSTKQMCISSMKEHEHKSLEEIRVDDYIAGRIKNAGATSVASSSLFGQQSALGQQQQQQGGLFAKPTGGLFSATSSAPTFPSATTASSLFGGQPQTGGLFGAAKPAGSSLFGAATSQPSGGLFGQQQQQPSSAFGSTTAGGAGLFGQNKPSAFGQVSQPSIFGGQPTTGGMFGGTAPSSVGGFGTATTTTTGLFGGQPQQSAFSFGQQPQQAAGSTNLFGAKPSQPFGFGTPPTQSSALFGAPLSKIGTGSIFGAQQQQPATGGLFGQAPATNLLQKPAQPSMFGTTAPQNMAGAGMFGTGFSQPTGFGGAAAAGSPPIILGSNVNISGIQQAIISAQLSSLPYGDSPLLKSPAVSPSSKALDDIASLQRQLHLSNRRLDGPSMFGSPKSDKSLATTQLDTTKSSATDLNGSFLEQSFTYKPLVLLPSVGFGAALGLHQSPKLKSKGDSLLKSMQSEDEKNVKSLDISVVYETVQQSRSNDADESNLSNEIPSEPSRIEFIRTPEKSIRSDISTASPQTNAQSPLPETSPQPHETSKEYRVKLTRPEYYCKPSVKELEELYHVDGTCQIESGLTVGRLGYGSVFWKGPIQLDGPVDLDEVVHFRNKEVVVYPDETTKPDVGTGLNRFAEVSLDRVWPVDPKTKQPIKDVDELRRFGFREKLERLCQRLDAVFRDYQPATGTWQFDVQHFSKYGFEDDENHQKASHNNGTAKRPIGFCDDVDSSEETENRLDFSVFDQEDSKLFQNGEVLQKKLKLDDTLFESNKLLSHVAKEAKKRARLIERLPKNAFKTVSGGGAAVFQKSGLVIDHRSCRVGFSNGHILTALNGHLSAVSVLSLEVVPTIKDILTIYKQKKSRIDLQLNALPSISGGLISFDPPSMLLRLLDTHVRNSFRTGESEGAQVVETILTLCDIVCVKVDSLEAKVSQRVQMGVWLKDRLSNRPPRRAQEPPSVFDGVFHHLVCGSHKKAVDAARHSRHYNLALLLSMFKCPTSKLIRDQVGKQLAVTDKKQTTAIGYANILELLSGGWSSRRKGCLEGLDWLQILGVLIWYHSSPWTTLSDAVNQLETLVEVDG